MYSHYANAAFLFMHACMHILAIKHLLYVLECLQFQFKSGKITISNSYIRLRIRMYMYVYMVQCTLI